MLRGHPASRDGRVIEPIAWISKAIKPQANGNRHAQENRSVHAAADQLVDLIQASTPTSPELAAIKARQLFGCFRKGDANDPDTYAAAIAAVLTRFPPEVVAHVTDPRSGLPSRSNWLPTVHEVRQTCDERSCELNAGPTRAAWHASSSPNVSNTSNARTHRPGPKSKPS